MTVLLEPLVCIAQKLGQNHQTRMVDTCSLSEALILRKLGIVVVGKVVFVATFIFIVKFFLSTGLSWLLKAYSCLLCYNELCPRRCIFDGEARI